MFEIPPPISVSFATRVDKLFVVRLSSSSRFFMQSAAFNMRASNSSRVSTFNIHKQKSNLGLEIHTARSWQPFRIIHMLILTFYATMTDTVTSLKN
jgi:hypothetical protein